MNKNNLMKTVKYIKIFIIVKISIIFFSSCQDDNPSPDIVIDFIADKEEIAIGNSITFTDMTNGNPTNWIWTFEGGTPSTSTEQNPTVIYENSGNYDVTLVASNNNKSSILTKNNYINVLSYFNDSLVAYYPFNGNANDESEQNNHGVINGAILTSDRFGNSDAAYEFNGNGDYITIPHSPSFEITSEITVALWVTPKSFYTGDCEANFIISKGFWDEPGFFRLGYNDNQNGNGCGDFNPENQKFAYSIRFPDGSIEGLNSSTVVELNNTYFIVGKYDGKIMYLYINGVLEGLKDVSKTLSFNSQPIVIGKYIETGFPYFINGTLDDMRIYNKSLSENEILNLYTQ